MVCFVRRTIQIPRKARATRKPRLLFRFVGLFLLRFADRQFLAVLFQLPPRFTRFEPYRPSTASCCNTRRRNCQLETPAVWVKAVKESARC